MKARRVAGLLRRHRTDLLRHGAAAVALAWFVVGCDLGAQTPVKQVRRDAPSAAAGAPLRIAVFDSRLVFDSMPGRSAAESVFALEQAKARTMLGEAVDSLQAVLEVFTKAEGELSPRQREAAILQLRARELMVEEMASQLDHIIQRRQLELQSPIRDRVRAAVRDVRLREGYDIVLDLARDDVIIDADARADITAEVLRELRRAAALANRK
jgi:outer membrane protein